MPSQIPQTVKDAIILYSKHKPDKNIKNLKTVLRRYILLSLPGCQFIPSELDRETIVSALRRISIEDFRKEKPELILADNLTACIEAGTITRRTADGYRSEFRLFTHWMQKQDWYIASARIWDGKCAPLIRLRPDSELQQIKKSKTESHNKGTYALQKSEFTEKLKEELADFTLFWTGKEVEERQSGPIRTTTLKRRKDHIFYFLGWLKHIQNWEDDQLSLRNLEDIKLVKKMVGWGINVRGNSYAWAMFQVAASISVATWLYADQSNTADYKDIEVIENFRVYRKKLQDRYKPSLPIEAKELTHDQCVALVMHLRRCTVPKYRNYKKRSLRATLMSWQRYLIIAILTYCPLRGREIRELQLNRTLVKDQSGNWLLKLKPEDHKTGSKTHEGREVNLSEWLPQEVISSLNEWIEVHRMEAREAAQDFHKWLAFWQHDISELESLPIKIQEKYREGKEKYARDLERELQGLHNLIDSWETVKSNFDHNYIFFSLGSNQNPATLYRPFCDPDPDTNQARVSHFVTIVKQTVRTATAVLAESEHPLFIGVDPKSTTPHFFRHIGSTHIRRKPVTSNQLKAFHAGIGNSVEEGDRSYSLLTEGEKTAEGADWWKTPHSDESEIMIKTRQLILQLSPEERKKLGLG